MCKECHCFFLLFRVGWESGLRDARCINVSEVANGRCDIGVCLGEFDALVEGGVGVFEVVSFCGECRGVHEHADREV